MLNTRSREPWTLQLELRSMTPCAINEKKTTGEKIAVLVYVQYRWLKPWQCDNDLALQCSPLPLVFIAC